MSVLATQEACMRERAVRSRKTSKGRARACAFVMAALCGACGSSETGDLDAAADARPDAGDGPLEVGVSTGGVGVGGFGGVGGTASGGAPATGGAGGGSGGAAGGGGAAGAGGDIGGGSGRASL